MNICCPYNLNYFLIKIRPKKYIRLPNKHSVCPETLPSFSTTSTRPISEFDNSILLQQLIYKNSCLADSKPIILEFFWRNYRKVLFHINLIIESFLSSQITSYWYLRTVPTMLCSKVCLLVLQLNQLANYSSILTIQYLLLWILVLTKLLQRDKFSRVIHRKCILSRFTLDK